MPNEPYVEKIMVADGDGDNPDVEEVKYEKLSPYEESTGGVYYGHCSTAADTRDKVITLDNADDFKLKTGTVVIVQFTVTNNVANPRLNVNDTGVKDLKYNNAVVTNNKAAGGTANYLITYTYDGTAWNWTCKSADNTWDANVRGSSDVYCETVSGTAAKIGIAYWYTLRAGSKFSIRFKNANTAQSALTLSIDGKAAKPLYINGAASSSSNYAIPAGDYECYYDGTNYYIRTDGKSNDILVEKINNSTVGENPKFTDTNTWPDNATYKSKMLDYCYPVGSIYMSTKNVSPATFLGGTWISLSGYMLRGATSGVTANSNAKDGGADSVTVSSVASHNHTQDSHNHTQDSHNHTQDSHNHTQNAHNHPASSNSDGYVNHSTTINKYNVRILDSTAANTYFAFTQGINNATATNNAKTATNQAKTATNQAKTATNQAKGANYSVATLPQYKNVYMWERTA